MANEKASAKGRKIGRNSKKLSTQRGKARFDRCQDNRAKRILSYILNGNNKTKHKTKPTLREVDKSGTFTISGYKGYLYIAHNKSLVRR